MDLICFTKLLQPCGPDELIAFARKTGLAGYDLTVREGHPVTPETIGTDLAPFVRRLSDAGLQAPLATIGGDVAPVGDPATETAWAACAEAGIGMIKLGYWRWAPGGPHYWDQVESVRAEYNGRYAPAAAAGGPTSAAARPWKQDSAGNLAETAPALKLLEPDIAYLSKVVAGA